MEKSGGNLWVSGLGQAVTRILLFCLLDCLSDKTLSLLTLLLYNIKFFFKNLSNLCFYSVFHFVDITHSCILLYPCTLPVRLVLAKHEDGQSEQ